jgi:iron(III) transport system ATP-binding protein
MSELVLTDVGKAFGGPPVLDGVNLTVPAGSLTAVLGPSGCGKTTLLRLVAGFDDPDTGTIILGGRTVAGLGRPG